MTTVRRVWVRSGLPRRRRPRVAVTTLLAVALVVFGACDQGSGKADSALVVRIDALAAEGLEAGPLAGMSIAVAREGRTVVSKGYGLADVGRGLPATADTVYRIGSLTMQFTAAAVLQLVEAGRLSLDDDLATVLPDFATQGRHVTVRHLLNHTSGIKNHTELAGGRGEPGTTRQAVVDLIAAQPFDFEPGEQFRFTNSGYVLLGLVIEKVTGASYPSYLEAHVFEPLGLRRTTYCPDQAGGPGQARGYEVADGKLVDAPPIEMSVPFAAAGLCSTVGDLLEWSAALRDGRVISEASYQMMTTPTELPDGTTEPYGFGLPIGPLQGHGAEFHDGAINGFMSRLTYFPYASVSVALLTNTVTEGPGLGPLAAPLDAVALGSQEDAVRLDNITRGQVIDAVLSRIKDGYVFPDKAEEMEQAIRARQASHEYDDVTSGPALARLLTTHLQEVSHDKHLHVDYFGGALGPVGPPPDQQEMAEETKFGFERVDRLPGNIGYIQLTGFLPAEGVEARVAEAMTTVHDADALIFDLRDNGGGDPGMVALISSYLFGEVPVHLNDLSWRQGGRTEQLWTQRRVEGARFGPDKDVYVLTSERTFSAAEAFAYDLQVLGRATIVGETTGGGAHLGDGGPLILGFGMFLPTGRATSPVTGTDWEGTGVTPDVKVAAASALETAASMARQALDDERLRISAGDSVAAQSGAAPYTGGGTTVDDVTPMPDGTGGTGGTGGTAGASQESADSVSRQAPS